MRALMLTLVVALLAAGCASPAVQPAATAKPASMPELPRPEVKVPTFLAPIELGTIVLGSEPNVGVAPDGTVYVSTPLSLWRSDDQGQSFKGVGAQGCLLGSRLPGCPIADGNNPGLKGGGDGAITVTSNGTVFWLGLADAKASVPVQRSTDKGEHWSDEVDMANGNSSDREWLSIDRAGTVYAQWRDFGQGASCADPTGMNCPPAPSGILVRASFDNGTTWRNSTRVTDDGHQGPIAHDPTSAWMYLPHVNGSNKLQVARSNDSGLTWNDVEAADIATDTYQFPIAAVDRNGTAYVVYVTGDTEVTKEYLSDRLHTVPAAYLIVSHDHGATWSKPVKVSPEGQPVVFPWIVAGDAGRVAISFYEGALPGPMAAPNQWHVTVAMSTTADQAAPKFASAFVSATPNHVGQICVVGSGCGPQDRSLLDFFEIRMMPNGSPVLAFVGDNDIKMATVKVFATKMTEGTSLLAS